MNWIGANAQKVMEFDCVFLLKVGRGSVSFIKRFYKTACVTQFLYTEGGVNRSGSHRRTRSSATRDPVKKHVTWSGSVQTLANWPKTMC